MPENGRLKMREAPKPVPVSSLRLLKRPIREKPAVIPVAAESGKSFIEPETDDRPCSIAPYRETPPWVCPEWRLDLEFRLP